MNNIYHFHSRKELYGKNVNIYRKEKSNKEYFKYSNVMYDVKNYKKIKLDKSNINFKRGGGRREESLKAHQETESRIARDEIYRRQGIEESNEETQKREAQLNSYRRSLESASRKVGRAKIRELVKAEYRLRADEDNRPKSFSENVVRASSAENESHSKKRDKLLAEIKKGVIKVVTEAESRIQSEYA